MSMKIARPDYAAQYGPTTGDRIHLADTGLVAEIEHDYTTYGDELVFGGGKTIRDGMGQASKWKQSDGGLDMVITNAVIIDPVLGVVKGDIGVLDGEIVGIGKAGNPDTMNITPGLIVSPNTDILSVEGMICTPGFVDIHPHFDSVQQLYEYQNAGFTTVIGGGSGPKTVGIECPGVFNIQRMLEAMADIPLNFGNFGKGNAATPGSLVEQILAGATGLKIHEDWSSSPAAIETTMELADEYDFQVQIHADTLNETGYYEDTIAAINGRVMHIYHCEGAGGGNAPDMMRVCGEPNLLPSSTNPTNPFSINTYDEEIDMLITCHNLNKSVPTDIAFIQGRARAETMRAEDVLHDIGAISMIGSDSQGVGRAAESAQRSFQLAAVNKVRFGRLSEGWPGQRQLQDQALHGQGHHQPGDLLRRRFLCGLDHAGKARGPGLLAARVLHRQARGHAEGRLHLARGDGRPGGLADDRPAAQVPAAVRLPWRQPEADLLLLRHQGGDRQWS